MSDSSENKTKLYVLNSEEGYDIINPETIASAVADKKNADSVQTFIDSPVDDWPENWADDDFIEKLKLLSNYQYASGRFVLEELLNNLKYKGIWKTSADFSEIELPAKIGHIYKVVGDNCIIDDDQFFENDIILIIKNVPLESEVTSNDILHLKCSGNGNGGVAGVVENYSELLNYDDVLPVNSIMIVANDERHNDLLSFYELLETYDMSFETKDDYDEYIELIGNIDVEGYRFSINEETNVVTLNEYIGSEIHLNPPVITGGGITENFVAKILSDETHNDKPYFYRYKDGETIELGYYNWEYKLSRKENGIFHVRGTVEYYNQLPSSGNVEGDVYIVLNADPTHDIDAGDWVVWIDERYGIPAHWEDFGCIIDLSLYYTKTEVNSLLADEAEARQQSDAHLETLINDEYERATDIENVLAERIDDEITRATNAENDLTSELAQEIERAVNAEESLDAKIDDEITRAEAAEAELARKIEEKDSLPPQEGNDGKYLTTNGTNASWVELPPSAIIRKWVEPSADLSDWEYTDNDGDIILDRYIGEGLSIDIPQITY